MLRLEFVRVWLVVLMIENGVVKVLRKVVQVHLFYLLFLIVVSISFNVFYFLIKF
jgi:hypothetical protein